MVVYLVCLCSTPQAWPHRSVADMTSVTTGIMLTEEWGGLWTNRVLYLSSVRWRKPGKWRYRLRSDFKCHIQIKSFFETGSESGILQLWVKVFFICKLKFQFSGDWIFRNFCKSANWFATSLKKLPEIKLI